MVEVSTVKEVARSILLILQATTTHGAFAIKIVIKPMIS